MPRRNRLKEFKPESLLASVRHVALDMDGTIYSGGTLFPFTLPFLERLKELGIGHTFLTNNSSKSSADYLAKLNKIGIPATADQLFTSTQATIEFLQNEPFPVRRVFLLGTPSLAEEISAAGFVLTADDPTDEPDAVIVGFDTTLSYARLCRAAYWIAGGKRFVATHPDLVCPTDELTVLVDCGAICAALEKATGQAPDTVLGKPDPHMLDGILARHKLAADELAMVGDRLYTDIAMARHVGAVAVLVLSGESTRKDVPRAPLRPNLVVENLQELGELLSKSRGLTREPPWTG